MYILSLSHTYTHTERESEREREREMENEASKMVLIPCLKSSPMNGGNGPTSYAQNSYYQRGALVAAKGIIHESIADNLNHLMDSPSFDPNKPILIADMGCSVGPNTFIAVQNIIEALELNYNNNQHSLQKNNPKNLGLEFQVFFNDLIDNDFNTLFTTLPPSLISSPQYFVAGVPGSFYSRLFPKSTLHIVHSTYSLHWLSDVPKQVIDRNSLAWNKGRVHYYHTLGEVQKAYSGQFERDLLVFLSARAQELVEGGLMVLLVTGYPNGVVYSETCTSMTFELLGDCLKDMAKMGLVNEEKVDSFNIPIYFTNPNELKALIETNGCFNIERFEEMIPPMRNVETHTSESSTLVLRAAMEGVVAEHFGSEITDELFERFECKFAENVTFLLDLKHRKDINMFVLLRLKN